MPLFVKRGEEVIRIPRGIEAKGAKAIEKFLEKKGGELPPATPGDPIEPVPFNSED